MTAIYILIPFVIKFAFYFPWCSRGLKLAQATGSTGPFAKMTLGALKLTLLRLLLGLLLGGTLYYNFAGYKGAPQVADLGVLASYLVLMLPTRWLEWGITEAVVRGTFTAKTVLFSGRKEFIIWRILGTAIGAGLDMIMGFMFALMIGC